MQKNAVRMKLMSLLNRLSNAEAITASVAGRLVREFDGDLDRVVSEIYASDFNVERMSLIQETCDRILELK